jgi:hypothetical protein
MDDGAEERGALIVYGVQGTTPTRRNQFHQKLYGQTTSTRGQRYHRVGILERVPHWRVARGVLLVRESDREVVLRMMRAWTSDLVWWPVPLRARDRRRLSRPESP